MASAMALPNDADSEGGDPPCWAHLFDECADEDVCSGATQEAAEQPVPPASQPGNNDAGGTDAGVEGRRNDAPPVSRQLIARRTGRGVVCIADGDEVILTISDALRGSSCRACNA